MTRRIVCAGIPRSGSTWLFNAVRLLAAEHDGRPPYGAWVDDYDAADPTPVHIVKVHDADAELAAGADSVLTSRRDLRDVAASLLRRGWASTGDDLLATLDRIVDAHGFWRAGCLHETVYERMIEGPAAEATRVAAALGLDVTPARCESVAATVDLLAASPEGATYDRTTLLHPGHFTDGRAGSYRTTVPPDLLARIETRHGSWLRAHGYALSP